MERTTPKLKRVAAGEYVTEDGRFTVAKGHAYTDCENPHPVQIAKAVCREIQSKIGAYGFIVNGDRGRQEMVRKYGHAIVDAVLDGHRGYFCEGGEEHAYDSWGVWDIEKDDYVPGGEHFNTKSDAVDHLKGHLNA